MPLKDKQQMYKYQIQRWINRKIQAIEYMGGKCSTCGYDKYYGALEFHHTDPKEKDHDWSKLRLKSWDKILTELQKCILLCSNCHKELHHKIRMDSPEGIEPSDFHPSV